MQLSCVHCGKPFTITTEQLGGSGRCPHCQGAIRLPKALAPDDQTPARTEPVPQPSHWWENSISGLVSLVFHMILMLVLALISYDVWSGEGGGNDVLIGDIPSLDLSDARTDELSAAAEPAREEREDQTEEMLEVEPPVDTSVEARTDTQLAVTSPSLGTANMGSFDLGAMTASGSISGGGSWGEFLGVLRQHGLDIAICFDSTASMAGEIREVKEQIRRIGGTLMNLVPNARISICTYRDEGDEYVVKGMPLSNDLQELERYLASIDADGGGDAPEAVHKGLQWAVEENRFRGSARKVILLFGDQPPHREHLKDCLSIASDFARQQKGIVSTVTCRRGVALSEFEQIAQMGGGEAFLTSDERQIVTQLMVLVFGSRYREKVFEAFRLLGP